MPEKQVSHSSKSVDAICHDKHQAANTSHNGNGHIPPAPSKDCPNCAWQHPASRTNCPTQDSWLLQMQQDWTLGTEIPQWQATSTKKCTSAKECNSQLGHSMGSPDAHLGATTAALWQEW